VADLEADVPHERQESFQIRAPGRRLALGQQNHDVDVGAQIQLAAPVAADGHQRDVAHVLTDVHRPRRLQQRVDQPCAIAHQPFDGFVIQETLLETLVAFR
jgi:hypothetical protein